MNTKQSKKMLPLNILDILNKYSDENHRLSQKDISDILRTKYNMTVERKAVRSSITDLLEMGVAIQYTEKYRTVKDKKTNEYEEQLVITDLYMEHDFTNGEICLLIDEILNADFIPTTQRRELISKLENLSSVYFNKGTHVRTIDNEPVINQLFYTLEIVKEAIATGKNVKFYYKRFITGKNGFADVKLDEYIVTPYDTGMFSENYYLFCSEDGISEIRLRLDYITEITLDQTTPYGSRNACRRNRKFVVFAADETMLSDFVEMFGIKNIRVEDTGIYLKLNVWTDEATAIDFAIKNSSEVTALEPEVFRYKVADILRSGWERYGKYAS
jgi:hypothetical protein